MNKELTPSRYASRSSQEYNDLLDVLNDCKICTVSFLENGKAKAIPTGFCVYKDQLVIHGSTKSHFLNTLLDGQEVCVTTFNLEALVLAVSAFEHSVNYRSAVIFSKAHEITDLDDKRESFKVFTDKFVPGRWDHLRPIKDGEMAATKAIAFSLDKASVKTRNAPATVHPDGWEKKVWTGIIPVVHQLGNPEPGEHVPEDMVLPAHIVNMIKNK